MAKFAQSEYTNKEHRLSVVNNLSGPVHAYPTD